MNFRSLAWDRSGISVISSRKSVPPSATSTRPRRVERASVKAPFSWPNSSLSTRSSGRAAQLTSTNGASESPQVSACRLSAARCLPTPEGPRTKTGVVGLALTLRSRSVTSRMAWLRDSTVGGPAALFRAMTRRSRRPRASRTFRSLTTRSVSWTGLVR